jgi:hypothetical protein
MSNASQSRYRLLLGLGLMVLVVGAIAVYTWLASQPAEQEKEIGGEITARQAFPAATEVATQWQADAHLVSAAAQWLKPYSEQDGKSIEWSFQFFSPSTQQVAIIAVHDGAASKVSNLYTSPMPTLSIEDWQIDSDQAWLTWLENGGRGMLQRHPDTALAMTLHLPDKNDAHPVWQVGGVVAGKRTAVVIVVDAANGTVVE